MSSALLTHELALTDPLANSEWQSSGDSVTVRESALLASYQSSLQQRNTMSDMVESLRSQLAAETHRAKAASEGQHRVDAELRSLRTQAEQLQVEKVAAEEEKSKKDAEEGALVAIVRFENMGPYRSTHSRLFFD